MAVLRSRARHAVTGSGFVTRSGQTLLLNGYPYRMLGFNMWRANVSFTIPNTGYLVNAGTTLNDSLAGINAGGGKKNTIRAWFFQQLVTPTTGGYTWGPFDKTLQVAAANNFKVIACLNDQWSFEGPPFKDAAWYGGGYTTSIYSGTANAVAYNENVPFRQYVADVVARYAGNPAIAAWELVNEADCSTTEGGTCPANAASLMSAFLTDVARLIKSIDPNHLVSLGVAGNGNCGTIEGDYQTVMASPYVDLCSFHDYYGPTNAGATNTFNGLNVRIPQAAALKKPIYVGEVGMHLNDVNIGGNMTTRATYLDSKMSTQFALQGVVGYLPWHWDLRGYADDFNYSLADPALAVMDNYAL